MSGPTPHLPAIDPAQALAFLVAAGCDTAVDDTPRRWLAPPPERAPPESVASPAPAPAPAAPRAAAKAAPVAADHPALACADVPALLALLGRFPDARTRSPLLYDGNLDARIWVLIDRPDADSDHRSTIDRMLAAIGLDWTGAALVSRLPWPTPGDGEPTPQALTRFAPVVERLAHFARPSHILALGQCAAEIAGPEARRASSRGLWHEWAGAKLMPSIHPRTMAGNVELKRQAFEHLKAFKAALA
ncbi:MAG: hypothetical protein WCO11_02550 [Sphingomonadales bacterium]